MVRILLISFLTLVTLFSVTSCGIVDYYVGDDRNVELWNETASKEFLKISELKKLKPAETIYETEGYVVDLHKCGCGSIFGTFMFCKCLPDGITISEQTQLAKRGELGNKEIRVLTKNPDSFKRGQKYRFKIRIPESHYNKKVVEHVVLVAYRQGVDRNVE